MAMQATNVNQQYMIDANSIQNEAEIEHKKKSDALEVEINKLQEMLSERFNNE